MSYLEKVSYEAYEEFFRNKEEIEKKINTKIDVNDTHPLILAYLKFFSSEDTESTYDGHMAKAFISGISSAIFSKKNESLNNFLSEQKRLAGKNLHVLCPTDDLVGDFAHTKLPDGASEKINEYLRDTLVFIEFPKSSSQKGVFATAVYIDGFTRNIYTNSSYKFDNLEKKVKENSKKFYDEMKSLVDMILLYFLSSNVNKVKLKQLTLKEYKEIKNKNKLKSKLKKSFLCEKWGIFPPENDWRVRTEARSWELTTAFEVRGHWRWQACGVGRLERKLIWIAAHQKGKINN